jgi:beta-aspartyl-peptidase (threonine type)
MKRLMLVDVLMLFSLRSETKQIGRVIYPPTKNGFIHFILGFARSVSSMTSNSASSSSHFSWSLVVHGGAWSIPDQDVSETEKGVRQALIVGSSILRKGGSSLDAVEAAVRVLEDAPIFDAGIGSVLNEEGEIEMDAMIMDGKAPIRSGSVICVRNVRNPVSLARGVMEKTSHCMLSGLGAEKFAQELMNDGEGEGKNAYNLQFISLKELTTPQARQQWEAQKQYQDVVSKNFNTLSSSSSPAIEHPEMDYQNKSCDTVGAVALDVHGNLAAATSTGGISFKKVFHLHRNFLSIVLPPSLVIFLRWVVLVTLQ